MSPGARERSARRPLLQIRELRAQAVPTMMKEPTMEPAWGAKAAYGRVTRDTPLGLLTHPHQSNYLGISEILP